MIFVVVRRMATTMMWRSRRDLDAQIVLRARPRVVGVWNLNDTDVRANTVQLWREYQPSQREHRVTVRPMS